VVLDSNIYISSIFWDSGAYIIVSKAINQEITAYRSNHITDEIKRVLARDFGLNEQEIDDIVNSIHQFTNHTTPKERIEVIKDDPDDDRILECAVACNAKYIISYNKHLLKLKEFRSIRILAPKEFLGILNKSRENL